MTKTLAFAAAALLSCALAVQAAETEDMKTDAAPAAASQSGPSSKQVPPTPAPDESKEGRPAATASDTNSDPSGADLGKTNSSDPSKN